MKKKKGIYARSSYHHYRPRFYLKGFVDPSYDKLVVFEKGDINPRNNFKPVKNVCVEPDFFTMDGYDDYVRDKGYKGLTDKKGNIAAADEMEKELSKREYKVAPLLRSVRENKSFAHLSLDDFFLIVEWASWLNVANPLVKKCLQERDPFGSNTTRIGGLIDWNDKIFPFFKAKTWGIIQCSSSLLTSDRTVILYPQPKMLLDYSTLSKAKVFLPLSPELLLVGEPNKKRRFQVGRTLVFNEKNIFYANMLTYQFGGKIFAKNINTRTNFLIKLQQYRIVTLFRKVLWIHVLIIHLKVRIRKLRDPL